MRLTPLALLSALAGTLAGQTTVAGPVISIPIQPQPLPYKIVAVRMPREANPANEVAENFPDASNHSLYVGRKADLVLIHPNGTETMLVDASHVFGAGGGQGAHPNASIVDPVVSFNGRNVYFSWFEDPQDWNTQRDLSRKPAHIMRVNIASGALTQLTDGATIEFADTANAIDPQYAKFDVAPTPLPGGKLLFLSNREGILDAVSRKPAMRFFRMNNDGSNVEVIENFTQGTCEHPIVLKDGRIVWTHMHPAGRRQYANGNYPLMIAEPDMSDWKTFAGVHYRDTAWHFTAQLSNGDVVTVGYYHFNNFGHGTLLRMPVDPAGQDWGPVTTNGLTYPKYGWPMHAQSQFTFGTDSFPRIGETAITPWNLAGSLSKDDPSPIITLQDGTQQHAGKLTMPSGAPNNDLLCIWSPGGVNKRNVWMPPHMKIACIPGGDAPNFEDMDIIHEDDNYHYMYPKAVVTYAAIYGQSTPTDRPGVINDGNQIPELEAGTPFATMGTSTVYTRESAWPASYADAYGPDPWDINTVNNAALRTAIENVGQDRLPFDNSRMYAAQVVADMSHFDSKYVTLNQRFQDAPQRHASLGHPRRDPAAQDRRPDRFLHRRRAGQSRHIV